MYSNHYNENLKELANNNNNKYKRIILIWCLNAYIICDIIIYIRLSSYAKLLIIILVND